MFEVIDPQTLHLKNGRVLWDAISAQTGEPERLITVRIIALQFDFVPHCVARFRRIRPIRFSPNGVLRSATVFLPFPNTNVQTMVVPGSLEVPQTRF